MSDKSNDQHEEEVFQDCLDEQQFAKEYIRPDGGQAGSDSSDGDASGEGDQEEEIKHESEEEKPFVE